MRHFAAVVTVSFLLGSATARDELDSTIRTAIELGWPEHRTVYEHLGDRLLRNHETSSGNGNGPTFEIESPVVHSIGSLKLDHTIEQYFFHKIRATGFHLKQENATIEYRYKYRKAKNGLAEGKIIAEALETIYDVTLSSKRLDNGTCHTSLELLTVIKQVPLLVEIQGQKTADATKLAHSVNRWFSNEVNNFLYVNVYVAMKDIFGGNDKHLC